MIPSKVENSNSMSLEALIYFYIFSIIQFLGIINSKQNEKFQCPKNHFRLYDMSVCHRYLGCEDLNNMDIVSRLGSGAVKDVYLVNWKNIKLVMSVPINPLLIEDFLMGVNTLKLLNPSEFVVQYLGFCEDKSTMFTEYHSNGDAATLFSRPKSKLTMLESLEYCYQYMNILNYIHQSSLGPRVFCDSNTLDKLLSQLLVTVNLQLILNDVDALPQVINSSGIKCGRRQLLGPFVAPEQIWHSSEPFNDSLMSDYDEKTDIWKAAAVCEYFLSLSEDSEILRYRLFNLHKMCRAIEPSKRPKSDLLVNEYKHLIEEFLNHPEL